MPPLRRQSFSTGRLLPAISSQQQRAQQQELSFSSVTRAQGTELLLLSRRHPPPRRPRTIPTSPTPNPKKSPQPTATGRRRGHPVSSLRRGSGISRQQYRPVPGPAPHLRPRGTNLHCGHRCQRSSHRADSLRSPRTRRGNAHRPNSVDPIPRKSQAENVPQSR